MSKADWEIRVTQLIDGGDARKLLAAAAERLVELSGPFVDSLAKSVHSEAFNRDLVLRCIAYRDKECVKAIHSLAAGSGFMSLPHLRPLAEDLIFADYLISMDAEDATKFLENRVTLDILQAKKSQEEFFNSMSRRLEIALDTHETAGQSQTHFDAKKRGETARDDLKELGKKLGWGKRISPTIEFMADKTDRRLEYDFFYRASSAAVHSSLHHFGRLVWGDPETSNFSISSDHMEEYYRQFGLVYGVWLFEEVIATLERHFHWDSTAYEDERSVWMALVITPTVRHGSPPLVTDEELRWRR